MEIVAPSSMPKCSTSLPTSIGTNHAAWAVRIRQEKSRRTIWCILAPVFIINTYKNNYVNVWAYYKIIFIHIQASVSPTTRMSNLASYCFLFWLQKISVTCLVNRWHMFFVARKKHWHQCIGRPWLNLMHTSIALRLVATNRTLGGVRTPPWMQSFKWRTITTTAPILCLCWPC